MKTREGNGEGLRQHLPSDPSYLIAVVYCLGGIVIGIIGAIKESPATVIAALLPMAFGIREFIRVFRDHDDDDRQPPDQDAHEHGETPATDSDSLPDDSDGGTTDTDN